MEMASFADDHFIKQFNTYAAAARYYDVLPQYIQQIKNGTAPPNNDMLLAMGFTKVKTTVYKRVS